MPPAAIRLLPSRPPHTGPTSKLLGQTFAELSVIHEELVRRHLDRVILVTSRQHGRRTRALWDIHPLWWPRSAIIQHPEKDGYVGDAVTRKEARGTAVAWLVPWTLMMTIARAISIDHAAPAVPPATYLCI